MSYLDYIWNKKFFDKMSLKESLIDFIRNYWKCLKCITDNGTKMYRRNHGLVKSSNSIVYINNSSIINLKLIKSQ